MGKAFEKLRLDRRPYVVIYDQTPKNERALKNDHVDFLIDQNGYVQGYEPPRDPGGYPDKRTGAGERISLYRYQDQNKI